MPQSKGTWLVGLVGIAVIVVGIWWWSSMSGSGVAPLVTNNNNTTPSVNTPPNSGGTSGVTANSDAALSSNLSSIDAKMSGFSSDSASMDQGLNDKPVPQN